MDRIEKGCKPDRYEQTAKEIVKEVHSAYIRKQQQQAFKTFEHVFSWVLWWVFVPLTILIVLFWLYILWFMEV